MRVLHLVHQYPPEYVGGTELYTQAVARGQTQRGQEVAVFCRGSGSGAGLQQRIEEGVAIYSAWSGPLTANGRLRATFGDASLETAFERVLDRMQPDIIHVQHLMGQPVALMRIARRRHIPFVITLHDYWWVCANAQLLTNYSQRICAGPRAYLNCARCALARANAAALWPAIPALATGLALRNRLLAKIVQSAAALIAPMEFVRRWYIDHGFPADRVRILPPALGDPNPPTLPQRHPDHPVRFAYIGGLSRQKGVHVLVEAATKLRGAAEVWIAGDESFDPAYVAGLRARATNSITLLGKLDRAQVWATLAQTDVVVVPTLWYETFSLIVSEAFMAGRPVVASRLGPLTDRVADGVDGLLVAPGDADALRCAMQRLVDDPEHLARLQIGVRPPSTLSEHLTQLEEFYLDALRKR